MTATTAGRFEILRATLLDRSLCPACGAPLTEPRCLWCGVPLDGAAADRVLRLSIAAAESLAAREAGVRALFGERDARFGLPPTRTAAVPSPLTSPAPTRPAPRPVAPRPDRPAGTPGATRPGRPTAPAAPRWTVQSVLQVLGAGLLSAAGIVFLAFSWGVLDLQVRAALVAVGTVVVFATASLLARRGLRQGAEAIGAVAAVLLLLDAWALRRTGVVTLGEPGVYASSAALVCAVLLAWWGTSARLRVGTVAAAVLLVLAPLPLASVLPGPAPAAWALLGSVVTSWVRHTPALRTAADDDTARASRIVLSTGAALAWPVAALLGIAQLGRSPDDALGVLAAAGSLAAVHGVLVRTRPAVAEVAPELCWRAAAVATGVVTATIGSALGAVGIRAATALVLAGLLTALVVVADRTSRTPITRPAPGATTFRLVALSDPSVGPAAAAALLVASGGGALLLPTHQGAASALLALTVLAGVLDLRWPAGGPVAARTAATRATLVAAVLGALVGARTSTLAAAALAACAAVSVLGRRWGRGHTWSAASTAVAAPWGVAAIGLLARAAGATAGDSVAVAGAGGAALLALVVVAPDRPRSERTVALAGAASSAGLAWGVTAMVPHWWGHAALLAAATTCLVVVLALTAGGDRVSPRSAAVAAGAAAPVLALAVLSAASVLHPAGATTGVVLLAATVGTASVLLGVVARDRRGPAAGLGAMLGGGATLGGALLGSCPLSAELAATVLLMAAVAAFGAGLRERRPTLRWVALALATTASWTLLRTTHPGGPEAFTAPTAITVAVVGARRLRRARPEGLALLGSGLALTFLPTALLRGALLLPSGLEADRRLLTTTIATAVTLIAARRPPRRTDGLTTLLAGLGLVLTVLGPLRAAVDAARAPGSSAVPELLGLLAAVLLTLCCRSVRHAAPSPLSRPVRVVEPWVVTASAVLPSSLAAAPGAAGQVRASALAAVGIGLALAGAGRRSPGTGPWSSHLMGVGTLVSTAAAVCAVRALPAAPGGSIPALLGLLLMTTLLVRPPARDRSADTVRAAAALALLLPLLVVRTEAWRPFVWLGTAVALVAAAWGVRRRLGGASAVQLAAGAAAGVAMLGPWGFAVVALLQRGSSAPAAPEPWTLSAAVVVAAACTIGWPRRDDLPTRLTLTVPALVAAALPSLLAAHADLPGAVRLVAVVATGTTLAFIGQERRFDARRPAAADDARVSSAVGIATAAAAALTATTTGGPWSGDVPIVVLGVLLTALGLRRAGRDQAVGSWRAVGPGLMCALAVPAVVSAADAAGWRPVVVILLALTATLAGAVRRWQAPFVVGAVTLVVVTAVQIGPWAGHVLVRTQGWVLLAACGALLLALGLRYERRIAQAREAVRFVTAMR